jgi:hypothetical protein
MHPRHAPLLVALASTAALLSACAPEPAPDASGPVPATSETTSATPTPASESHLVVTIDGLEFVDGEETESADFENGAAVLALLETATGEAPAKAEFEDPPGYETDLVRYEWDGISVVTEEGGEGASAQIVVDSVTAGGVPITSLEGLTIGSTRDQVIAAQGWDVWDEDGDGVADYLGVGEQQVPGTTSLSRPGETGILYVMFSLADDVVTTISAPANDFSDL